MPPGAASTAAPEEGQQVALPNKQEDDAKKGSPDAFVIQDEDGSLVTVHEPKKTVRRGNTELELKPVSKEEKDRRRSLTNLIVWGFCALVLGVVVYVLIMVS